MTLLCDRCGENLLFTGNFCPYCGMEAPKKTIVFQEKEEKIENPKYCPHCRKDNEFIALYCRDCGEMLHQNPERESHFCGKCSEKNRISSSLCCVCGNDFEVWYGMRGEIAQTLGHQGDLTLYEKMNDFTYHFRVISGKVFTIGRNKDNDIVIPCSWVSGSHCRFDFKENKLIDSSSNGTFINRRPVHISSEPIDLVSELNIADAFTFNFIKVKDLIVVHLGAINDEEECRRNGDGSAYDRLRKTYYILLTGDCKIRIQKLDGHIRDKIRPNVGYYDMYYENGFYYFSDEERSIRKVLIMRDKKRFPLPNFV